MEGNNFQYVWRYTTQLRGGGMFGKEKYVETKARDAKRICSQIEFMIIVGIYAISINSVLWFIFATN